MARRTLADAERDIEQLNDTIAWQNKMLDRCKVSMQTIDQAIKEYCIDENADLAKLIKRIAELEYMILGGSSTDKQNIFVTNTEQPGATPKPAGRKPHNTKWQQSFEKWRALHEQGKTAAEISQETGISRMTCYRYQKYYDTGCENPN